MGRGRGRLPEIAAQWDVICAKFLDLADHDVEIWLCGYSRVIDVVPLPLPGGSMSMFFRYNDIRREQFMPFVTKLGGR